MDAVWRESRHAKLTSESLDGGYFLGQNHNQANLVYLARRGGELFTRIKEERGSTFFP